MASITHKEYKKRFDAYKQIRHERVVKQAGGTALIFDETRMIRALVDGEVPEQVAHCILKVFKQAVGNDKERFLSAFNICGACFINNGYMYKNFKLTAKGKKNEMRHQRERGYKLNKDGKEVISRKTGKRIPEESRSVKAAKYRELVRKLWTVPMEALRSERKRPGSLEK